MERVKKNGTEKARRDSERHHLDRISRLFKAPQQRPQWSKKEVLILGESILLIDGGNRLLTKFAPAVLFLFYGPDAFPHDFVEARPDVLGL